jgi:hypothetical protein
MNINLEFDAQAMAAPQSFRDGMRAAANALDAAFVNNITVNIAVGYGEFLGSALPNQNTSEGNIDYQGNDGFGVSVTYQQYRTDLAAHGTSSDQQSAAADLPNVTDLPGDPNGNQYVIGSAQAKAFGILAANNAALDGAVGIGRNFTGSVLFNGALHELTHAMGRIAGTAFDLFRFSEQTGARDFYDGTIPDDNPAYFSIDGGRTNLGDFGITSDPGDFLNGGVQDSGISDPNLQDPFDETVGLAGLTQTDLTVMEVLGFNIAVPPPPPAPPPPPGPSRLVTHGGDFNGDAKADILFQNHGGQVWQWLMNANQIASSARVGSPGSSWHVVGAGRFTGAALSDVLMQNDSGDIWEWQMSGSNIASSAQIGNPGASWHVVGIGAFTNSGKDDILMQNDSGDVWEWQMNGNQIVSSAEVGNPGEAWHVVGTGDFTGSGISDVLFQKDDGAVLEWQMNGNQVAASGGLGNPGQSWHVAGTGNFGGGSLSDILFQNGSGQIWEWQVSGFSITGSNSVGNPGSAWHVAETGDFNGDGKADILLQNSSGQVWQWLMNGAQIASSSSVGSPGSSWGVV